MEEKILTNENELQEIEATEDYESERSGGGFGKLLGAGLIAGIVAAGVVAYKKVQPKLESRKVEKLRKKGYVIYKEDECEVRELEVEEDVQEESEE